MNTQTKIAKLAIALSTIMLANCAQAELSMNGQTVKQMQPQTVAKIEWGGNLAQAESIMHNQIEEPTTYTSESIYTDMASSNVYHEDGQHNNADAIYLDVNNNSKAYTSYNNTSYNNNYDSNYKSYKQYESGSQASSNNYNKLYLSTKSRAAIVYDVTTGETIYEKNSGSSRPIASISKLMTAIVTLDAGLNMNEEITITPFDFAGTRHTKKSSSRMKSGDRLSRSEMLLMTLMKSENPAAKSLARTYPGGYNAFMRAMNQKAQELGMYNTFFGDPTGLDTRNKASAKDLVKMIQAAGRYNKIRQYSTTAYHNFNIRNYRRGSRTYKGKNTSSFVRNKSYPISLSKTGYIAEAGKCMVLETTINNRPSIVVVLGASSYPKRNSDITNILNSLEQRW